jgi:hypothetical protein
MQKSIWSIVAVKDEFRQNVRDEPGKAESLSRSYLGSRPCLNTRDSERKRVVSQSLAQVARFQPRLSVLSGQHKCCERLTPLLALLGSGRHKHYASLGLAHIEYKDSYNRCQVGQCASHTL